MRDGRGPHLEEALEALRRTGHRPSLLCNEARLADAEGGGLRQRERRRQADRQSQPTLAGWATPSGTTWGGTPERHLERKAKANEEGAKMGLVVSNLDSQAQLAGWATPMAHEKARSEEFQRGREPDALEALAGWATPTTGDANSTRNNGGDALGWDREGRNKGDTLTDLANLASGPPPTSSTAATASSGASPGALNPAFSAWLMGYPTEWVVCGWKASRSRKKR